MTRLLIALRGATTKGRKTSGFLHASCNRLYLQGARRTRLGQRRLCLPLNGLHTACRNALPGFRRQDRAAGACRY
jgi:hypothetical protein